MDSRLTAARLLEEEEQDDDDEQQLLLTAAVFVVQAEEAQVRQIERRHQHRTYLTRPDLLPNPRVDTPWIALYSSQNDRAFITTMGFDVATFDFIIRSGFGVKWYSLPLPRSDAVGAGGVRPGGRSLDAAGALGLTLHYLNSTMREISLQQIFALVPATVSRYITHCLRLLLTTLREMEDARIVWPSSLPKFEHYSSLIRERHPRLDMAFASIDGLSLLVQESEDHDIENASYNGWTSTHNTNSVLVYSPEGDVIACNLNCPGSWHDSRVAIPIYERLHTQTPDGYYLVADTAFPKGTDEIAGRIVSPLKSQNRIEGTEAEIEEALRYNRELLSYRQTAEWGNRSLQGSFGRLRIPLDANNADARGDLLEVCVRLHNLRTRRVGINQIKEVYKPCWTSTEQDQRIWDDFSNIMFSTQRSNDRVSRFHIRAVYDD